MHSFICFFSCFIVFIHDHFLLMMGSINVLGNEYHHLLLRQGRKCAQTLWSFGYNHLLTVRPIEDLEFWL